MFCHLLKSFFDKGNIVEDITIKRKRFEGRVSLDFRQYALALSPPIRGSTYSTLSFQNWCVIILVVDIL